MTHNTLIGMMYSANGDTARGRLMVSKLMEDVKRLKFDGIHTLSFIFNSQRLAQHYQGLAFRINGACVELEDTVAGQYTGTYRPARLRRQYAVRAYGVEDLGLVAFLAALSKLPGVHIVDAERPRLDATDIVDSSYFILRFQDEQCPAALRGVTKVSINGKVVTLHHHVVHQRMPCARCYAPFHTTGFCKVSATQLDRNQTKFQRTYAGPVPIFDVGEAIQYHHTDGDSLSNFLDTLTRELTAGMATATETAAETEGASLVTAAPAPDHADQTQEAAGRSDNAQGTSPTRSTHPETTPITDTDGFRTVVSRSPHPRHGDPDNIPEQRQQSPDENPLAHPAELPRRNGATRQERGDHPDTSGRATQDAHPAAGSRKRGQKSKAKAKQQTKPPAFAKFKKAMAMGKYALLQNDDSDEEGDASDDGQDEAPYAYEHAPLTSTEAVHERSIATVRTETSMIDEKAGTDAGADGTEMMDTRQAEDDRTTTNGNDGDRSTGNMPEVAEAADMDIDGGSQSTSYVGSSPPSSPRSPATTPGSEFPYSLASEVETEWSQEVSEAPSRMTVTAAGNHHQTAQAGTSSASLENDLSQDGFIIEKVAPAPGMPQQLPVFLMPFSGALTAVPANGQCAYTALYATTTSTDETDLQFTQEVTRGANIIKRSVYTLMLTNLSNDVACKVVDPCRELRRLYPTQPAPPDTAVATAALFDHYTRERARSVHTHIPSEFWAGPEVLRAMAQYLREPLFVLEVNTHNDAHVQRYSYQDYTLPNGDTHETGRGGALDDASAKNMLAHYASLHVLPTMLVLKRHEGHFYGVHHGELATRWQAEGDLVFANENCSTHSWFDEIVAHNAYSTEHMGRIDVLNDEDVTNAVIIGATERRDRLDIIHDRLRLPRLDREPYDIAILDSDLQAEANRLHKQAGPARPASTDAGEGRDRQVPDARTTGRAPISTQGRVALQTMQRILDSMDMEPEFISDRSKMRQLQEENDQAAATWRRRLSRARTPDRPPPGGARDLLATVRWLLPHRDTLHDLLGYLPYPEVAVKMMPTALLQQWGELEVYDSQTSILRAMLGQESIPDAVRVYCRTWLAACTTEGGSTRDRIIAKDVTRWVRLANMHAAAPPGARPATMSDDCWHTLHILPYVIWVWGATPWGGASRSALSELYRVHPALQQLCEKVTGKMEWGDAVVLPSGITWEDRLTAMEAGQPAPPRC